MSLLKLSKSIYLSPSMFVYVANPSIKPVATGQNIHPPAMLTSGLLHLEQRRSNQTRTIRYEMNQAYSIQLLWNSFHFSQRNTEWFLPAKWSSEL